MREYPRGEEERESRVMTSRLPLRGVRILDLTRLIPGALCTRMLADLGAEVIKVEEVGIGDYERQIPPFIGAMASRFLILNGNKKSVALNLKTIEGREIFLEMAKRSDVVVEGFRPGVMKKLGLDYAFLKDRVPGLIYCAISSFGQDGPYRDVVAHDINILGEAGFFDVTGKAGDLPPVPGIQIADSIAGTHGALGIAIALMHREKTGKGQIVDVSMFDGVLSWMFDPARYLFAGVKVPSRGEARLAGGLPNYNLYETKDGKYIAVGSIETKFKNRLLRKLGREDLIKAEDGRTSFAITEDEGELHRFLREVFTTRTRDEWMEELKELNICMSPVRSVEEAFSHPQAIARKMVSEVAHPLVGNHQQIGFPLKFSEFSPVIDRLPAPVLGEHTREILGMLGYGDEEIKDMEKADIVGTARPRD